MIGPNENKQTKEEYTQHLSQRAALDSNSVRLASWLSDVAAAAGSRLLRSLESNIVVGTECSH